MNGGRLVTRRSLDASTPLSAGEQVQLDRSERNRSMIANDETYSLVDGAGLRAGVHNLNCAIFGLDAN